MSDGWAEMTLGEIAEVNPETTKGMPPQQHIRYIDLSAVSADSGIDESAVIDYELHSAPGRARRVVRHGDVLVSTVRPYLRGFAVVPESLDGAVASTGFTVLRARRELSLPGFVWSIVSKADFADRLMERATGSNYPAVRPNDIAEQVVLLPPLVVQRRVVDLVDAVDTYAKAAARSSESSSTHLAALCEAVFEVDAPMMAMTDLAVPKGLIGGPFGSSLVAKDYVDEGVPVIRGTNMPKAGCFVGGEFAHVSPEKADQLRRNLAAPGDVVFTQRGTLGQVGLVPAAGPDRYVVSQSQMRLRPNPDLVLGEYVFLVFRSPRMVAEVLGRNTATANPHINLGILAGLEIPVPALAEQAAIVEIAWSSMAVAERAGDLRRDVQRLRSALLDELLSGECEIPGSYDELVRLVA